jgi:hypothetical protein
MPDQDSIIRTQLLHLLRGGNAHMSFDEVVAGFPLKYINVKPPHLNYSVWHLLEHMRIAQRDILEFIKKPDYSSPDWPDEYWPPPDKRAGKSEWDKSVKAFRADLRSVQDLVRDPGTAFFESIPHAKKYTIFREILLVADHNAYHIGELAALRQVLGIKPPDSW